MRPQRPPFGPVPPRAHPALRAAAAAALALAAAAPAAAQTVLGDAPGAWVVPRGVLRVGVAQDWGSYDEAFGAPPFDTGSARVGFGRRLTTDSLGVRQIPSLARAQSDLRTLTGQSGFTLTLGSLTSTTAVSTRTTALDLEAGLGGGLALTVVVPVVRTLASVGARPDPVAGGANVGVGTASAASVRTQFETANAQLRTRFPACFTTSGQPTGAAGCGDVNALYTAATGYAAALGRVYGASGSGAAVTPLTGSAAQRAVNATIAQYNARFVALLGGSAAISDTVGGTDAAALSDLQTLLTGAEGGVTGDSLRSVSRTTLGDVEVGLRLRLIDTFHGNESRRLDPRGVNLRATVAGLFRVGTGHPDSPDDVLDVSTGDGQNDVEVAAFGDLLFGPRAWISVAGRYGRQLADALPLRIPVAGEGAAAVFLPAYTRQEVDRDLGDYVQFEATPRFALGNALGVELRYLFRSKQEDEYTGTFAVPDSVSGSSGVVLDASALGAGSEQREQRVGGALTYSTYAAYARGRARFPLEVSVSYLRTVSGRGGVPVLGLTRLQLRAYPRLFGR